MSNALKHAAVRFHSITASSSSGAFQQDFQSGTPGTYPATGKRLLHLWAYNDKLETVLRVSS